MSGTTPNYAWPYPSGTDSPDARVYLKNLALAQDLTVKDIDTDVAALAGVPASITTLEGAWTDWSSTFAIGASVTPPTKGSTTYAASYHEVGKTVDYGFGIVINTGGGWSAGSGLWYFPVPVTAHTRALAQAVGSVYVADQGIALVVGSCFFDTVSRLAIVLQTVPGGFLGASGPGTAWATGDILRASIRYERA